MERDIARVIITQEQLAHRISELGAEIAAVYPPNEDLTMVTILSGSIVFFSDLIRQLPMKMHIGLITVSSYGGATTESRGPQLLDDLNVDVTGHHVLIVDDILDTGRTLRMVRNRMADRGVRSVRAAVLLRKTAKAPADVHAEFVGFDIEDEFVVGYGLDYNNLYRNLPHVAVLKPELY
ncbi:MAG: hypoxanthine phosphoribosyltransferase [bacterium]|nr:hypoxanthine phosphoribosyltransferase [bacterium]